MRKLHQNMAGEKEQYREAGRRIISRSCSQSAYSGLPDAKMRSVRCLENSVIISSDDIGKRKLLRAMRHYGFMECARICTFLETVSGPHLNRADYAWINAEMKECLQNHDDGSERSFFQELRYLQMCTEYMLSLEGVLT
ncbi:hypothetical protein F3I27_23610 [Pantoea sp. Bo_2]|nr:MULTISPECIES: hypothetical protein [Pantoea]KAA6067298.1 hypothetical protein F3I27_23610 [Pantoea sp. Bo_2]KAA5922142.1 hypothetical protein F3I59_22535 [Pantoea sp. VH_8]KAA5930021.1 hypothetical protein F3I58_19860 [Pantoea sp. VH_4]KAA5936407.1 hypothetical protein F3I57_22820 [Pantoea sp. VH_3]KAA5948124.1 hypothetical protein F3I56_20780 [Pantoea sp. VH_25]